MEEKKPFSSISVAKLALALSIAGLLLPFAGITLAVAAGALGIIAKKKEPQHEKKAKAAIIIGSIAVVLQIVGIIVLVVLGSRMYFLG